MRLIFGSKVIKVEVLDERGKLLVTSEKGFTFPSDMSDDDAIIMLKGRGLPELERNMIVSVITTSKNSDRFKYTGAVSVSTDTQLNIKVLRNNDTQLLQERRRYFKIKINENGRALFYVRDEKTIRFDEPIQVAIKDINVGGIFFSCPDYEFVIGDLICFDIYLSQEYEMNMAAYVLRVQRGADGQIAGYGCEFHGLTAAQEDAIGRYILKQQSDQRAKEGAKEEKI